jgi:predicted SAM-dependent methyltransferase
MISIFTPTNNPKYLTELYDSIKNQPFDEWVILAQGCEVPDFKDERVKVYSYPKLGDHYVGALKKECCRLCKGDILLEVDHDDILVDGAVEEVKKAFKDKEVGFVYSNFVNFKDDFKKVERYPYSDGWRYRDFKYKGHDLEECISFPPTPEAVSRIWFAPNHLRAWRKEIYDAVGGHSEVMRVLDDQDLIARTYLKTKFFHIDKCLYLYRITGQNSWLLHNKEIQDNVLRLYDKYIIDLALKSEGRKVDLGGRIGCPKGFESVDLKDADVIADLNEKWPFKDSECSVVRSFDCFEHLKDSVHTMKELSRVLKPGGIAFIQVPSTDGRGAFQDPTHVSFWNENSFLYYTDHQWSHYIDTPVNFQAMRLYTTEKNAQQVNWVMAHLINLKENYRPPGAINL